jgi:hypothetical protein
MVQIIQTSKSPNPLPVLVVANRPPVQEGAIQKIEDGTANDVMRRLHAGIWRVILHALNISPAALSPLLAGRQVNRLRCELPHFSLLHILLYLQNSNVRQWTLLACDAFSGARGSRSRPVCNNSTAGVGVAAVVSWLFGFLQVLLLRGCSLRYKQADTWFAVKARESGANGRFDAAALLPPFLFLPHPTACNSMSQTATINLRICLRENHKCGIYACSATRLQKLSHRAQEN